MNTFEYIRSMVADGNGKAALRMLYDITKGKDFHNQVIMLISRDNRIEKDNSLGLKDEGYLDKVRTELDFSLLELISEIESKQKNGTIYLIIIENIDEIYELNDSAGKLENQLISEDFISAIISSNIDNSKEITKELIKSNNDKVELIKKFLSFTKSLLRHNHYELPPNRWSENDEIKRYLKK